jgi:hypothetical protein
MMTAGTPAEPEIVRVFLGALVDVLLCAGPFWVKAGISRAARVAMMMDR